MSQTLFERLLHGKEVVEFNHFNPAHAKIGSTFTLDVINLRGLMFQLREIWEYKRNINGKQLTFGDYVLLARPVGKEDVEVRLRFMPVEVPDAELTHDVLVLTKFDEMPYNEGLDGAVRDGSGEMTITDNATKAEETYWRNNNLKDAYVADVSIIKDAHGKVGDTEHTSVEYWDYSRETDDEAGQKFVQFLFVEMDSDSKMQTLWRGEMTDANRVSVL